MRCKHCPRTDEEARRIAQAFGLPHAVIDTAAGHDIENGKTVGNATDEMHRTMWHALVKTYRTLAYAKSQEN